MTDKISYDEAVNSLDELFLNSTGTTFELHNTIHSFIDQQEETIKTLRESLSIQHSWLLDVQGKLLKLQCN